MASREAVAVALKMLGRAFAGVVDRARIDVYAAALDDLSDAELERATGLVIKTHTGEFIPPPAVLRKAIAPVPVPVAVDAAAFLCRIEKLAVYTPGGGMNYPPVRTVRQRLGEAIGHAYAAAGGHRLFAADETTRSIATREFQRALVDAASVPLAALPVLDTRSLPAGASDDPRVLRLVAEVSEARGFELAGPPKKLAAGGSR